MINQEQIDLMIFEAQAIVHDILKDLDEEEVDDGEDSETVV